VNFELHVSHHFIFIGHNIGGMHKFNWSEHSLDFADGNHDAVCLFVSLGVRGVHLCRGSWLLSWTICSKCLRVSVAPPPLQATAARWHGMPSVLACLCSLQLLLFYCNLFLKGGMTAGCGAEKTSAMPLQLWYMNPSFWLFPRGFYRRPLFISSSLFFCMVCFYVNSNQTANILINVTHMVFLQSCCRWPTRSHQRGCSKDAMKVTRRLCRRHELFIWRYLKQRPPDQSCRAEKTSAMPLQLWCYDRWPRLSDVFRGFSRNSLSLCS